MPNFTFSSGFVAEAELLSFALGLWSVALLARGDGRGWPIGVVMVVLTAWVCWKTSLLGQAALQLYYFPTQLFGWYRWTQQEGADLRASGRRLTKVWLATMLSSWLFLSLGASHVLAFSGGRFPEADAFVAIGSLLGQTLIVLSYVEAWPVYVLVDVVSVVLFLKTGLNFYALMYLIFCGLALQGWWKWTRESSREERTEPRL